MRKMVLKFWLFSHSKKKDGVFDKIMNLFETRKKAAERRGSTYNIFDLYAGQDLIVTLSRTQDGKTTVQVVDEGVQSPLADSDEKMLQWINDEKKFEDLYTVKPVEYMEIIASGGVPVFDKEQEKWIDKLQKSDDATDNESEGTNDNEDINNTYTQPIPSNNQTAEDLPF